MSYDFYIEIDTGGDQPYTIDPYFDDTHPAFESDSMAGIVVVSRKASTGYTRCGNYTSNVSPVWTRCLAAASEQLPTARSWAGDDARAFNATGRTVHRRDPETGEWLENVPMLVNASLSLRDLNGKSCADLIPLLRAAVAWGVKHVADLRELDPPNGWGDAEGAITYLWDIQRACEQHPRGRLHISS